MAKPEAEEGRISAVFFGRVFRPRFLGHPFEQGVQSRKVAQQRFPSRMVGEKLALEYLSSSVAARTWKSDIVWLVAGPPTSPWPGCMDALGPGRLPQPLAAMASGNCRSQV